MSGLRLWRSPPSIVCELMQHACAVFSECCHSVMMWTCFWKLSSRRMTVSYWRLRTARSGVDDTNDQGRVVASILIEVGREALELNVCEDGLQYVVVHITGYTNPYANPYPNPNPNPSPTQVTAIAARARSEPTSQLCLLRYPIPREHETEPQVP